MERTDAQRNLTVGQRTGQQWPNVFRTATIGRLGLLGDLLNCLESLAK
jgi:hypothetical protein